MTSTVFQKDVLKDKVALITGGATGINFVVGKVLGSHGAKLVIMGRRAEVLQKAKEELTKLGITVAVIQG
jgi:NADP-dependent 3-hydroxy acid dehydrogenase YdfG